LTIRIELRICSRKDEAEPSDLLIRSVARLEKAPEP
jgi:hypothetical protein